MLSEEEKKAIHDLKNLKSGIGILNCIPGIEKDETDIKAIETILNLIEKQSKEIEELKNGQIDFWISDKEIEERIRNKFVSNDKIKAKIEDILNSENSEAIEKLIEWQSLLEKE